MNYLRSLCLIAVIQFSVCASRSAYAQEEISFSDAGVSFPSQVSHWPGKPQKPHVERPGDRNVSSNPAQRYALSDDVRAGCPESLGLWAAPSLSPKYSAGYAGGGTRFNSPHSRPRNRQEGTWGLDYTLWNQPKMAWLRWSDGSLRQSNGNFETDR